MIAIVFAIVVVTIVAVMIRIVIDMIIKRFIFYFTQRQGIPPQEHVQPIINKMFTNMIYSFIPRGESIRAETAELWKCTLVNLEVTFLDVVLWSQPRMNL